MVTDYVLYTNLISIVFFIVLHFIVVILDKWLNDGNIIIVCIEVVYYSCLL